MKLKRTSLKLVQFTVVFAIIAASLAACGSPISGGDSSTSGSTAPSSSQASSGGASVDTADLGDEVSFSLGHPYPAQDYRAKSMEFLAERVSELSGGNITITTFPSQTLTTSQDAMKSVANGSADMAIGALSFNVSEVPDLAPFDIQGIYDPANFWETYSIVRPTLDAILETQNQRTLVMFDESDTIFYLNEANKKDVHTPADIAGLRLRDHGMWIGKSITAWGASPMTIMPADLTVALERGTVDGGYTGWGFTLSYRCHESAPYITFTNLGKSCWAPLTMNLDKWDALTPAQQDILTQACEEAEEMAKELIDDDLERFLSEVEEIGGTVYTMTADETKVFVEATKPLIEEVRGTCGELGNQLVDDLLSAPSSYR